MAATTQSRLGAAVRSAPSTTYTAITPTISKSSEPCVMDASVDAPSTTTEAMAEEEDAAEDVGTIAAPARSGATGLAKTAGRTSLVRGHGGISLARTALRAISVFLHWCRHQGGMTTTIKTRGLGASRNHVP